MKFYSETLNKFYDNEEELYADEEAYEKSLIERKEKEKKDAEKRALRVKEVENAYNELIKARKAYNQKLNDFRKDYGFSNIFDIFEF